MTNSTPSDGGGVSLETRAQTGPGATASEELGASFRQSRKELWVMLGTWVVFALWVTGYCGMNGQGDGGEVKTVLGIPSWVFFGIGLPWLVANGFIYWFSMHFMQDTPLVDVEGETPAQKGS